jgi:transposase InsO family protein
MGSRGNRVWAYDFVSERTHDGRKLRLVTVIDEYKRERLSIHVMRRISSHDVLYTLSGLFLEHGIPEHVRSDNRPEFVAKAVGEWLAHLGLTTLCIEPGSPWENGYVESFTGKLRDELLNGEVFSTLKEAQIPIGLWRREYNHLRPHTSTQRLRTAGAPARTGSRTIIGPEPTNGVRSPGCSGVTGASRTTSSSSWRR